MMEIHKSLYWEHLGVAGALAISVFVLVATGLWLGVGAALTGVGFAILVAGSFRAMFLRKLQGYTGDCLGGVQQLSELGFYLGLALWLSH